MSMVSETCTTPFYYKQINYITNLLVIAGVTFFALYNRIALVKITSLFIRCRK